MLHGLYRDLQNEAFLRVYKDQKITKKVTQKQTTYLISIKYNEMVFCNICTDLVIFEALQHQQQNKYKIFQKTQDNFYLSWMEVKAEEELIMLEDDNFVTLVLTRNIVIFLSKPTEMSLQADHVAVKVLFKKIILCEFKDSFMLCYLL